MPRLLIILTCALSLAFLYGCAPRTYVGRAPEPVAAKKALRLYRLANGVTLFVKDNDRLGPTVVQVWVPAGSISDPPGKPGISHFVEHMLFTGSKDLPPGRAEQYVESMGGSMVGHTGRDFSYIGVTMPAQGWERGMDIVYDLVAFPSFRPDQMEKEKKVVAQEISGRGRQVDSVLIDNFFARAYQYHPYRNPVTGSAKDVASFTDADVTGCYRRTFVPSGMVVTVVGDVDPDKAKAMADRTFGRIPASEFKRPAPEKEPFQVTRRAVEDGRSVKLTYMALGWHVCSASDPDIYALEVLRAVLGQGKGSRLYLELRERMGVVSDVECVLFPLRDPGVLVVLARLREDDLQQASDEILRQVNRLKDESISEQELARAINNVEAAHLLSTESAEGQAYALGYWTVVYGGSDPLEYMQNIRKVTPADVRMAAQKYLGEGNYTLSVIKPGQ